LRKPGRGINFFRNKNMPLSSLLVQAFNDHPLGLCGQHDPAKSVASVASVEQRLNLITLGAVLDTNHLNAERWSALAALHDHWLLDPPQAAYKSSPQILAAMQQLHIAGPQYIARVWWQICRGVQGRFKGSWRDLLKANDDNAQTLQRYLQQSQTTFPVFAGPVISARWLDLIHRIGGVTLQDWDRLTVTLPPEQIKTARKFGITEAEVHPLVSSALEVWSTSCRNLPAESCGLAGCPGK
jgi:hypothetical protein